MSHRFCGDCVFECLTLTFSMKLSPFRGITSKPSEPHVWTDMEFIIAGSRYIVLPKNVNRAWLHASGPIGHSTFPPWPGKLPIPFGRLRGIFLGRLARMKQNTIHIPLQTIKILEDVLELWLRGFPMDLLQALLYSLPVSASTVAARRVFSAWRRIAFSQPPRRGNPTIGDVKLPRKVEEARQVVLAHDPAYGVFLIQLAQERQETLRRKEGQILANALQSELQVGITELRNRV